MTSTRSFERVNYLTRPNKAIERKLVFELLRILQQDSGINYRYVGFGSMWFVDFLLAHRILNISEMWSMEMAENQERAEFNRPYSAIRVIPGRSTDTLRSLTADDWSAEQIIWLDYDGVLKGEVVEDIGIVLNSMKPYSVFAITVNGDSRSYRLNITTQPVVKKTKALETLAQVLGIDHIPADYTDSGQVSKDCASSEFPEFIANAALSYMMGVVGKSGRLADDSQLCFVPTFNFCHEDGAKMVTIGGVLVPLRDEVRIKGLIAPYVEFDATSGRLSQRKLDLVSLTVKEKIVLDRLLPCDEQDVCGRAREQGIKLDDEIIKKYREYYRHFPVFTEAFL